MADDGRNANGSLGQSNVYAFTEGGQLLWKRGSGIRVLEGFGLTPSGLVVLTGHTGLTVMVVTLDGEGSVVWSWSGSPNYRFLGPPVSAGGSILINTGRELIRLNASGDVEARLSAEGMSLSYFPVVDADGNTYSLARQTSGGSACFLLSWGSNGTQKWAALLDASNPKSLQISADRVILAQTNAALYGVTGEGVANWRVDLDPSASSPVVGGNGAIYVLESDRMVVLMPGASHQALATMVEYGLTVVILASASSILVLQYRSVKRARKT
jgi:hypothetical protein